MSIVFKAFRFALHLVKIKRMDILFKMAIQYLGHCIFYPWFVINQRPCTRERFMVQTENPVAYDSPDHKTCWGTVINDITNVAFVRSMTIRYGRASFLDIGCSSGRLVHDFAMVGWKAVGLEGSDCSKKLSRGEWPWYQNLFTCDVSKPFRFEIQFNVVTAWDVVEHLTVQGLEQLCDNVHACLATNGIWIVTTVGSSEAPFGVELHQTQWTKDHWVKFFVSRGFSVCPLESVLRRFEMVRHSADGSEFVLMPNRSR